MNVGSAIAMSLRRRERTLARHGEEERNPLHGMALEMAGLDSVKCRGIVAPWSPLPHSPLSTSALRRRDGPEVRVVLPFDVREGKPDARIGSDALLRAVLTAGRVVGARTGGQRQTVAHDVAEVRALEEQLASPLLDHLGAQRRWIQTAGVRALVAARTERVDDPDCVRGRCGVSGVDR